MRFDPWANARVSIAGPILGGVAAAACYVVAEAIDSRSWFALAYTGFLLNLFNLVPVAFLDGGHVPLVEGAPSAAAAGRPRRGTAAGGDRGGGDARDSRALVIGMVAAHVPQDRL